MVWGAIAGALFGGISSAISTSSQNAQAAEATARQNKYQREVYDFENRERDRRYDYAVEGLEIIKRNNEQNLQFQEAERNQQYEYGMGIRDYEFQQARRVYDQSVSTALQQQSFNNLAFKAATVDQDRLIHEQMLSISMDETQTLLDYGAAAAGLGLQRRQVKGAATTAAQTERISALKASGASVARGVSGRSAAMNVQGILAESGARQAAIIDELMYNLDANDQQFFKMNQQLVMDQVGYEFSRQSAAMTDMTSRAKLTQQMLQSTINAAASIALKPEIAPPLPKPFALPRPEYQDVFKPGTPPPPMQGVAMQANVFGAALSGGLSGAQMGASIQSSFGSGGGFGGGKGYQYTGTNYSSAGSNIKFNPTAFSSGFQF